MKTNMIEIKGIKQNMVYCPEGSFWMGFDTHFSDSLGPFSLSHDRQKEKVSIKHGFWIADTVVTKGLWQAVMLDQSFIVEDDPLPAYASWYEFVLFCNRLSELSGLEPCFEMSQIVTQPYSERILKADVVYHENANGFRFPTEAEWEYSAKAGTAYDFSGSNNENEVAWHKHNSNQIQAVKLKNANTWGLYDMSGNVWEWCLDQSENSKKQWFNGLSTYKRKTLNFEDMEIETYTRVIKGGAFWNDRNCCHVAYSGDDAAYSSYSHGLRLVRKA